MVNTRTHRNGLSGAELDKLLLAIIFESEDACEQLSGLDEAVYTQLLHRARVHNALVLLSNRLHMLDPNVQDFLRHVHLTSVVSDLHLANQASKVVLDSGIDVLVMKGPVLWRALELASPSKISHDIDLLLKREDVSRADSVFKGLGYRCAKMGPNEAAYLSSEHRAIDLHWSLIRWDDLSLDSWERLWADRVQVTIEQAEVSTLSPTHTIYALAMHAGCHHLCADWASLHDISCCIKNASSNIDWQHIIDLATSAGLKAALHPPLALASEHFGAPVPRDILRTLRLPVHQRGLDMIARRGFEGRIKSTAQYENAKRLWNLLSQAGPYQAWILIAKWAKYHRDKKQWLSGN
jgi:hypothetical protein